MNAAHGTAAVSTAGAVLWKTQLRYASQHGNGGSPVLYRDLLIINCDGFDQAYVVALDRITSSIAFSGPCALLSGTKKSLDTNHWPTTARLRHRERDNRDRRIKCDASHGRSAAQRRLTAAPACPGRRSERRISDGHASYRVRQGEREHDADGCCA
jgi:hypothetical protein